MDATIVGARRGIIRLERAEQRHRAIGERADVTTIFRDDQLAFGIDPSKRARHPAKRMDTDCATAEMRLEQASLANIKPPRGIGGDIVGRTFTEVTVFGGENRGRHLFHHGVLTAKR